MRVKINLTHSQGFDFSSTNERGIEVKLSGSKKLGGNGLDYRPMELVLVSLASCSSFDIISIFQKKKLVFQDFKVTAEGTRRETIPQVFQEIMLSFSVKCDLLSDREFDRYIDLSLNKYCSVRSMLRDEVMVDYKFEVLKLD